MKFESNRRDFLRAIGAWAVPAKQRLLFALVLVVVAPAAAIACICAISPDSCTTDWKRREVVFLGKVTAKDTILDPTTQRYRVAVRFSVTEVFAGGLSSEKEAVVLTGVSDGDCGYPFFVGQPYLVYASFYQDRMATSICTPTRPAAMAAAIIRQLRALRDESPRAALFGMISTAPRSAGYGDLSERKALAGVRVRAVSTAGFEYSTSTDDQGVYSFYLLPADSYRLEVDLPKGLSTFHTNPGKPLVVAVGVAETVRGCSVDVFARPDTRVSGVVIDAAGRSVAGFVTIKPVDPKEAETALRRGGLPGYTTADGKFTLGQIPPGKYQLLFYPGKGQINFIAGAFFSPVIELALGEHIDNFQFKVPLSKSPDD